MDYKEKYDAALKMAREANYSPETPHVAKAWLLTMFPTIVESENEKIRKWCISHFKECINVIKDNDEYKEYLSNKVLAWLEKNGKEAHDTAVDDRMWSAISQGLTDVAEDAGWSDFGGVPIEEIQDWIEKQAKQPTDKIEPKFHPGDWITHNTANFVFKIINVGSNGYEVVNRENYKKTISFDNEDNYRLWTIADAKDGDVLYSPCLSLLWIFKRKDTIYCGCNLNYNDGAFCGEGYFKRPTDAIPATKEQRDLLFQKMADAGYEWNGDKKELKTIEVISKESEDGRIRKSSSNKLHILYQMTMKLIAKAMLCLPIKKE